MVYDRLPTIVGCSIHNEILFLQMPPSSSQDIDDCRKAVPFIVIVGNNGIQTYHRERWNIHVSQGSVLSFGNYKGTSFYKGLTCFCQSICPCFGQECYARDDMGGDVSRPLGCLRDQQSF